MKHDEPKKEWLIPDTRVVIMEYDLETGEPIRFLGVVDDEEANLP